MKKLFICFCLLCLFACSDGNTQIEHIEIGKIEFDNEIVTFYDEVCSHHDGLITTSMLYYKTDSRNFKNSGTMKSKDGTLKLYVDFYGNEIVTNALDVVIEPIHSFYYNDHDLHIYVLDASEKYFTKLKDVSDYSYLTMMSSATGDSSVSSTSFDLDNNALKAEVNKWTKIESYEEYAEYKDFYLFFEIQRNKMEIDNYQTIWQFYRAQLDDGRWIVRIDDNNRRQYYLLDVNQVVDFKKLIYNK